MHKKFEHFLTELTPVIKRNDLSPFDIYSCLNESLLIQYVRLETYLSSQLNPEFFKVQQQTIGVKLITVWDDLWITKSEIIEGRIKSLLGINNKVSARQTKVNRIDKQMAFDFLNKYHLQGATGAYYKLGLFHQHKLIAVATFSKARTMYDGPMYYRSYELERFACLPELNIVGGIGKLIAYFIKQIEAKHLMTYIDADWGDGSGYEKLGFTYIEHIEPQLLFINPTTHQRWLTNKISPTQTFVPIHNAGSIKMIWQNLNW